MNKEKLKDLRTFLGLSQAKMSELYGVTEKHYQRMESGKVAVSSTTKATYRCLISKITENTKKKGKKFGS